MSKLEVVKGQSVTVTFEGSKCIHSRGCVLGDPAVFAAGVQGEWIHPDAASAEEVAALARACPSGAIRYQRTDGGPQEAAPKVNTIRVLENGPYAVRADATVAGSAEHGFRVTLCRCGLSQKKPFCDNRHAAGGFTATGEPEKGEVVALESRGGPLAFQPEPDGPLHVTGNVEVLAGSGRTVARVQEAWLCRCGHSRQKPFCDGSHTKAGFKG
jgi:CDGSH-type Zn-finger protein/uncharacterized Fe-S cluster protein YjdI